MLERVGSAIFYRVAEGIVFVGLSSIAVSGLAQETTKALAKTLPASTKSKSPLGDFVPCMFSSDSSYDFRQVRHPIEPASEIDLNQANRLIRSVKDSLSLAFANNDKQTINLSQLGSIRDKLISAADEIESESINSLVGQSPVGASNQITTALNQALSALLLPPSVISTAENTISKAVDSAAAQVFPLGQEASAPNDVSCSIQILSWKETSDLFGRRVANTYIAIQVTIRNLNQSDEFLVHDIQVAVDTGITPDSWKRFGAGRDKLFVRGVAERGQSEDRRNLALNALQAIGAIAGSSALAGSADFKAGVAIFSGAFIPAFAKLFPDHTVEQLNHINDLGFSASSTSKVLVPVEGSVPLVTFVSQIPFDQLPFAWCGYNSPTGPPWRRHQEFCQSGNFGLNPNVDDYPNDYRVGTVSRGELDESAAAPATAAAAPATAAAAPATAAAAPATAAAAPATAAAAPATTAAAPATTAAAPATTAAAPATTAAAPATTATAPATTAAAPATRHVANPSGVHLNRRADNYYTVAWDPLTYKRWRGAAIRILNERTFVVVGGVHIHEVANKSATVTDLQCPKIVATGAVDIGQAKAGSITCTVKGTDLDTLTSVSLQKGTDKIDGNVQSAKDGLSATLVFDAEALSGYDGLFSLVTAAKSGSDSASGDSVLLAAQPIITTKTGQRLDLAKPVVGIEGTNLQAIESLSLKDNIGNSIQGKPPAKVASGTPPKGLTSTSFTFEAKGLLPNKEYQLLYTDTADPSNVKNPAITVTTGPAATPVARVTPPNAVKKPPKAAAPRPKPN